MCKFGKPRIVISGDLTEISNSYSFENYTEKVGVGAYVNERRK